jgi:hypothetical protein
MRQWQQQSATSYTTRKHTHTSSQRQTAKWCTGIDRAVPPMPLTLLLGITSPSKSPKAVSSPQSQLGTYDVRGGILSSTPTSIPLNNPHPLWTTQGRREAMMINHNLTWTHSSSPFIQTCVKSTVKMQSLQDRQPPFALLQSFPCSTITD